ncbi:aromatic ring-hydroxylating dioxygenase subunit alpha (plasmid) [Rhodococcus rhodochrous]|uniref:aromatic ring-hydroxylating oxygenase subunit alpha n=1 Tax=Rhodococcus rhodochrous TaxID=1829 RepID=UPI00132EA98C|nr:aromatic ring-hydroxylating dioxygenase subunit alpha [Rhodococcus rhodochrous]QHG85519.1 aromatic ring-hydroxylating dioxygenase subunit alpha [Rhodococcus rhodochrous]
MSVLDTQNSETPVYNPRTLPFSWYTDPEIFKREQEQIFKKYWLYAGPVHSLPNNGDFFRIELAGVPVIVTRDNNGEIHAMVNVCRHRGAEVKLEQSGNCNALTCHYHAWTYGLDGSLMSAPRARKEVGFDKKELGLRKLRVDTYGPFIFVSFNNDVEPLAYYLGELPGIIENTGVNLDRLEMRDRKEYRLRANWKVVVENFLECYHCPNAHPSFADAIDLSSYGSEEYGFISTQHGPPVDDTGLDKLQVREGRYNFLWPMLSLNIYPGHGNVSTNQIIPIDENNCIAIYEYFWEEGADEQEAQETNDLIHQVMVEDIVLCESVQRGMESGQIDEGRLITAHEHSISHFQDLVRSTVGEL